MTKNVVLACGLGDIFTFLTRLPDFFEKNKEYDSIRFWTWIHTPALAKELCTMSGFPVSIVSVSEMVDYLKNEVLTNVELDRAAPMFIEQDPGGVGVDKYLRFMGAFFDNIEEWVHLYTYTKYESQYPFVLEHGKPHILDGEDYIVVHPFSTTVKTEKPERIWHPAKWKAIIGFIDKVTTAKIVVVGGANDIVEDTVTTIGEYSKNVIDLRGKTTLTQTINLVYGAKAVIGTNTLTTEISAWAGIPTYVQWFVQEQLIPTHVPSYGTNLEHLVIDTSKIVSGKTVHPSAVVAWEKIRKVLDYAACPVRADP